MTVWGAVRRTGRAATATISISLLLLTGMSTSAVAEPAPTPTAITVPAATAGTRDVGVGSNIWGRVSGAPNAPVRLEVLVGGSWRHSQSGMTDETGFYKLPLTHGADTPGTYTFRAVVTVDGVDYTSPQVALTRTPVAVKVSAATTGSREIRVGTNIWGRATGAPNAPVMVQALVNGSWSTSRKGTTSETGSYALPLTYGASTPGTYTFRTVVTVGGTRYASPTVTFTRTRPAVTITAATAGSRQIRVGTNIWGTAKGAPNARVSVQALVRGAWSTSQTGTTNSTGFYALPLTYGATVPGTYTFRTVVTKNGRNYTSPSVTLKRTAPQRLDPRCYTSGVVICASKKDRKVYYVRAGKIIRTLDARFGGRAYNAFGQVRMYSTKEGTFTITRKIRDEISYAYGNAPMPFSSYFYGGQAFHYSYAFAADGWIADWGSRGCINLRDWAGAQWLYNNSPVGTRVVVYK